MRPSMASADASANNGTLKRGVFPEEHRGLRSLLSRSRLRKDAFPHPQVSCVRSPWGAVLLRTVTSCSDQGHADGLLFVSPP